MASQAPAWSVVIPTFDRHGTLAACLERLAPGAQSLEAAKFEVVVTDDARSEKTRAFLAGRFPWVRWVAGPGRGPAANRNCGARAALGEWLAFTDDDTLPSSGWLSAYASAVAANPGAEALEGRTTCAAGFGTPMHYAPVNERGGRFWSCNIAVRADRFRALHGFDERFTVAHMEDQDLRERLRAAGVRIAWVPEAVVDHPPRRQPSGRRLGLMRAAEVRYLYKHGAPPFVRWRLTRAIASLRLGIVRSLPWSVDSLRALASLATELLTVQWHFADWARAARQEFSSATPPTRPPRPNAPLGPTGRTTVSVIIPSWKRPEAIARCLRALAAQRRAPDEIIVVTRHDDDATRNAARAVVLPAGCQGVFPRVAAPGVIAAMDEGVELARGTLIALTDDDTEPRPDWIERLVRTFESDTTIGGVGGRDWQPHERGDSPDVGRVQWFGRVIGRHHLGAGPARDVDVLKGANCAFRAMLLRTVGFDRRLRGIGAQLHWELGVCLPMRRAGWRLVYDPAIAVDHHVEVRAGADQLHRGLFAFEPFAEAVHNEALLVAEHLGSVRRVLFALWSALVGTTSAPGLLAALRLRSQGHAWAWEAWGAARRGRRWARAERLQSRGERAFVSLPVPGSLP